MCCYNRRSSLTRRHARHCSRRSVQFLVAVASRIKSPSFRSGGAFLGCRRPDEALLAPYLAEAHLSAVPSISRILIWNSTRAKSAALAAKLRDAHPGVAIQEVEAHLSAVPSISRILVWNRTKAKSAALAAKLRDAHPGVAIQEVEAHLSAVPSISRILVWNRTRAKSAALAAKLRDAHPGVAIQEVDGMDEAVAAADVVSCATGSQEPIVRGELLRPGAHLDLVGSFTPAMRECDDEALRRRKKLPYANVASHTAHGHGELVSWRGGAAMWGPAVSWREVRALRTFYKVPLS